MGGMPPGGGAPPAAPAPSAQAPSAPTGPLSQAGLRGRALLGVLSARKQLELAAPLLGIGSEEGKAVYSAIKALAKLDVQAAPSLTQAEAQAGQEAVRPVQVGQPGGGGMMGPMPGPGSQPG